MKRIIPLLLTALLLICSLTSCLSTQKMGDYLGDVLGSVSGDETEHLVNNVAREAMLSGVIVNATHYSGFMKYDSQGSGVIFHLEKGYYYVLTNYHVAFGEEGVGDDGIYTVTDAFDRSYNASLVAHDEGMDLALLRFVATNDAKKSLKIAPLAKSNAPVATQILSVGNPDGLHNAVSIGDIIAYKNVDLDELDVSVIYHTAPLDHGSSGGGIYSKEGELVGINYAVGESEDGEKKLSFAIPIASVLEFLAENGIEPVFE